MNGRICDNCAAVLALDASNGREDSNGELAAWVEITAASQRWDACSRSCATELLADGGVLARPIDEHLAAIADIARVIREDAGGEAATND